MRRAVASSSMALGSPTPLRAGPPGHRHAVAQPESVCRPNPTRTRCARHVPSTRPIGRGGPRYPFWRPSRLSSRALLNRESEPDHGHDLAGEDACRSG